MTEQTRLTFLQLNMEEDLHLEKQLKYLRKESFDLLLLQEMTLKAFSLFKDTLGYHGIFADMRPSIHSVDTSGIAILSKKDLSFSIETLKDLRDFGEDNRGVYAYKIIKAEIVKAPGDVLSILTTHLPVDYPATHISPLQKEVFEVLENKLKTYTHFVLTGDLNSPRSTKSHHYDSLYDTLVRTYKDALPQEVTTTIDSKLHRNKDIHYTVDTVASHGNVTLSEIEVVADLSDHMGIQGTITF